MLISPEPDTRIRIVTPNRDIVFFARGEYSVSDSSATLLVLWAARLELVLLYPLGLDIGD